MAVSILENVPLADYVTLKTGGAARYFITVTTVEQLKEAVAFAQQKELPFVVLGGGSNVLIADEGFKGVVILLSLIGITYAPLGEDYWHVTAAAGEELDILVADTVRRDLWGLENLSHIPGSVGATPVQNVGAYGVEVADVLVEVCVFDVMTKKIVVMKNAECDFLYRHSIFKEKPQLVILSVTFLLSVHANPNLAYADLATTLQSPLTPLVIRQQVINIRSAKFPDWHTVGTAGSFFKNPIIPTAASTELLLKYPDLPTYKAQVGHVKISLGYVLDKICGLKGFTIGSVRLYEKQALVLVAEKGATTTDIKNFVKIISEKVFEKTFIKISQEVTEI